LTPGTASAGLAGTVASSGLIGDIRRSMWPYQRGSMRRTLAAMVVRLHRGLIIAAVAISILAALVPAIATAVTLAALAALLVGAGSLLGSMFGLR